jgi:hypothetical protein
MKWSSILVLGALAFFVNACEKHPASQLPPENATAFGEHAWPPKPGTKPSEEHAPAPAPAPTVTQAPAAPTEGAGGEAPKFFPEKK